MGDWAINLRLDRTGRWRRDVLRLLKLRLELLLMQVRRVWVMSYSARHGTWCGNGQGRMSNGRRTRITGRSRVSSLLRPFSLERGADIGWPLS